MKEFNRFRETKIVGIFDDDDDILDLVHEKLRERFTVDELQVVFIEEEEYMLQLSIDALPDIMIFDLTFKGKDVSYLVDLFDDRIEKIIYTGNSFKKHKEIVINKIDIDGLVDEVEKRITKSRKLKLVA